MTDHIIQSTDGQTYDLTTNRIAFGLLPDDVQAAMKAWPHGWELFNSRVEFEKWDTPLWGSTSTYRAIPTPKVTEYVLYWREEGHATTYFCNNPVDTHRITLRDDGKGNMTATVEKL
jgi:hypothetical protein